MWIELVAISALLAGLELTVLPHFFVRWNPSPLWLLVILIAMRYGSPAGIAGGSAAACLHLWDLTRSGFALQELLHRNPQMLVTPVLYIFVGMYLGEVRERLAKRGDHYQKRVEEVDKQLETSEIKRMNLERTHLALEKRLAGQPGTLLGVYESLNRLNVARNEEEIWPILCDIVQTGVKAEAAGVWMLNPPRLLAVAGAMEEAPPPLALLAGRKRALVTLADWTGGAAPGAELAAAVVDDPDSPIVLAVSGIGFTHLNRNSVIFFELVAQRASFIIGEMRRLGKLRQASINDPELGLMSEGYLRNRVGEQILLARRHGNNLSLVGCAFRRPPPPDREERYLVILACAIKAALRASDGVAYFHSRQAFGIMLPQTDLAGAEVVVGKVEANLALLDLKDGAGLSPFELKSIPIVLDGHEDEEAAYKRMFSDLRAPATGGAI